MPRIATVLVLLLFLIGVGNWAHASPEKRGLAILFDNSGSMVQHFDKERQLKDAKQLVMDLVFEGTYDESKWDLSGDCEQWIPLWHDEMFTYIHAFGQLGTRVEPFFSTRPDWAVNPTEADARTFIQGQLLDRLSFRDRFTIIDLARKLSWWNIAWLHQEEGRDLYMDVLLITDNIPDVDPEFEGIGTNIEKAFSENQISEAYRCLFMHKDPSRLNADLQLRVQLYNIGPHYIAPEPDTTPGNTVDTTSGSGGIAPRHIIRMVQPVPDAKYPLNQDVVTLQWECNFEVEHFQLYIDRVNPRRSLVNATISGSKKFNLSIPRQVMAKLGEDAGDEIIITAWVEGIYSEAAGGGKKKSQVVKFSLMEPEPNGSFPWWMLVTGALLGLGYYGYRTGLFERGYNWLLKRFGGGGDQVPGGGGPKEPDW